MLFKLWYLPVNENVDEHKLSEIFQFNVFMFIYKCVLVKYLFKILFPNKLRCLLNTH